MVRWNVHEDVNCEVMYIVAAENNLIFRLLNKPAAPGSAKKLIRVAGLDKRIAVVLARQRVEKKSKFILGFCHSKIANCLWLADELSKWVINKSTTTFGNNRPSKRLKANDMEVSSGAEFVIIHGNSHPELANQIANRLGFKSGGCSVYHKTNRETMVEIGDSVRGKDIYIIQTGTKDVNNNIMELLIMAYACKTSSARSIVGVIPYLPYSKQCKMRKRGCIVSKLLAKMMCKSGLSHIITMDLHQKEIQGFFDCPVDNLRASPFLLQYIQESIPDYRNAVIVARNPGSAKKATSYAERLRLGIAVIHGEQKESESDEVDGRYSPPPTVSSSRSRTMDVSVGVPCHPAKEKPPINVVGDVGGRIAIMVDDLIDDVHSFVAAAEVLKERGAYKIYVLATHGLLSSDAPRLIEDSAIDEVVVTNTIPHEIQKMQCHKIKTVDISVLIAEAIRRIHNKESMSYLFRNVTLED